MSALILDVATVLILILFVVIGFKNGIVKSFVMFVGAVFASLFSGYLSDYVARWIYNCFLSNMIRNSVSDSISRGEFSFQSFSENMPKFVQQFLFGYGITPSQFGHIIDNSTTAELPGKISNLLEPAFVCVLKSILVFFIFVILMILIRVFMKFILKIFKCKPLKYTNSFLGAIFGALKGYVIICVIACCAGAMSPVMGDSLGMFSQQSIEESTVFKAIYLQNPISGIAQNI